PDLLSITRPHLTLRVEPLRHALCDVGFCLRELFRARQPLVSGPRSAHGAVDVRQLAARVGWVLARGLHDRIVCVQGRRAARTYEPRRFYGVPAAFASVVTDRLVRRRRRTAAAKITQPPRALVRRFRDPRALRATVDAGPGLNQRDRERVALTVERDAGRDRRCGHITARGGRGLGR